jgi:hypothetical protein
MPLDGSSTGRCRGLSEPSRDPSGPAIIPGKAVATLTRCWFELKNIENNPMQRQRVVAGMKANLA